MTSRSEIESRFVEQIRYVDELAQIVLKGHLVMEEVMTEALGRFLLNDEFVEPARLMFHQKVKLCRAISASEKDNSIWDLIEALNSLRNHLSHSLDPAKKSNKLQTIREIYSREFPDDSPETVEGMNSDSALCMLAISGCLGSLSSFLKEIKSFERVVDRLRALPPS